MFAVIAFGKTRNRFRRGKITSERIALPSGEVFFVVTAEKSFGKIPWKKLEKCLGVLKHNVVLMEDVEVPRDIDITVFIPHIFPRLLLMNSATDYIKKHKSDFISENLTVYDEKGIYTGYIEPLIQCFSNIKIVTGESGKYEELSESLMKDYGFSLVVTDKESFDSGYVISHKCKVPVYYTGKVFTNEKKHLMNTRPFYGSGIILPKEYEKVRPDNMDSLIFASALYEKCGAEELKNLKYENFGC